MISAAIPPQTTPAVASHQGLSQHEGHHRLRASAERHADSDLSRPLSHQEGHHPVDANRRQHQGQHGEAPEQLRREPPRSHRGGNQVVQRSHTVGRLIRIGAADFTPERRSDHAGIPGRLHHDRQRQVRRLPQRPEHRGPGRLLDLLGPHVVDDADDRDPSVLRLRTAEVEPAPDGIFARPVAARHGIGDHRHQRRLVVVLLGERPSAPELGPNQLEIARRGDVRLNRRQSRSRFELMSFDRHGHRASAAVERQRQRRADRGHAGNRARAPENLVEENHARLVREVLAVLGLVGLWQPQACGEHPFRFEPQLDMLQAPQTSDEQRGADEEHERKREFGDDERRPQRATAAGGAPATFFQRVVDVGA